MKKERGHMSFLKESFGTTKDGIEANIYTISNDKRKTLYNILFFAFFSIIQKKICFGNRKRYLFTIF